MAPPVVKEPVIIGGPAPPKKAAPAAAPAVSIVPTKAATTNTTAIAPAPRSAKRALPGTAPKKTPARRPKRPKKEDRSTTTTTTSTANTPVNVYDAVLGEAEDLLAAAMEAQALGRLKMASAYQLLLHARLVGLGKRFDRAQVVSGDGPTTTGASSTKAAAATPPGSTKTMTTTTTSASPVATKTKQVQKNATPDAKGTAAAAGSEPSTSVEELAKLIPSNIELDGAMMEHLARAAMELHHQRTGRRIQSDSLLSPPPKPTAAAATTAAATKSTTTAATGVAWTEQELQKCQTAMQKGSTDPIEIAKAIGSRTEAQVKAYLRNTQERQKGAQAVEQEWGGEEDSNSKATNEDVSPRRRGGRGRKPPTQAMNTVPNAKLDARSLLSGTPL